MHSFIIVAKDQEKRKEYIGTFCRERKIGKFDEKFFTTEDASFGLAQVREMQSVAFLKPVQSEDKVLILEDAEKLTIEAQNALLKLLEEPPHHTYIFLSCASDANFLPTILSRCKKIVLSEEKSEVSQENFVQYTSILDLLTYGSIAEKLYLAEKLTTNKDEFSHWLQEIILFLRDSMLHDPQNTLYPHYLTQLQYAYQLFQTTNVSPRVILEHTFFEL